MQENKKQHKLVRLRDEVATVDNTRTTRNARSKSPFRMRQRSKSPFRMRPRTGIQISPWRRRNSEVGDEYTGDRFKVHESDISAFQQLCLDKYDKNAAIEILLDSSDSLSELYTCPSYSGSTHHEPRVRLSSMKGTGSIDKTATFSTSSTSTERGSAGLLNKATRGSGFQEVSSISHGKSFSRALSKNKADPAETRRAFLNRLYFKSPDKYPRGIANPAAIPAVDIHVIETYRENSCSFGDVPSNQNPGLKLAEQPTHKSSNARNTFEGSFRSSTTKQCTSPPITSTCVKKGTASKSDILVFAERFDSFSNLSSLSGSRATEYGRPLALHRHESLGIESIKDIQVCLKEMEYQLTKASNTGRRVSRQKVMRALLTVADSLEDEDGTSQIKREFEMAKEKEEQKINSQSLARQSAGGASDDDKSENTTSDADDFTYDSSAFEKEDDAVMETKDHDSSFNLMSFFGIKSQNQQVVGEVLDDLLWSAFVSSRQDKERYRGKDMHMNPKISKELESPQKTKREKKSLQVKYNDRLSRRVDQGGAIKAQGPRSWWRNQPSTRLYVEEQNGYDDDDESSSGSEEFPSYLPTSIIVQTREKKTALKSHESPPVPRAVSNRNKVTMQHQTENRHGYEMGKIPRRTRLV